MQVLIHRHYSIFLTRFSILTACRHHLLLTKHLYLLCKDRLWRTRNKASFTLRTCTRARCNPTRWFLWRRSHWLQPRTCTHVPNAQIEVLREFCCNCTQYHAVPCSISIVQHYCVQLQRHVSTEVITHRTMILLVMTRALTYDQCEWGLSRFPLAIAASFAADMSDAVNSLPTVLPALIADFPISLAAALDKFVAIVLAACHHVIKSFRKSNSVSKIPDPPTLYFYVPVLFFFW